MKKRTLFHKCLKNRRPLNKKQRTIQIIVRVTCVVVIIVGVVVACIAKERYDESVRTGRCKNGAYVGDREIDIENLFTELDTVLLVKYDWYEEVKGESWNQKLDYYNKMITVQINCTDKRSSNTLDTLTDEERDEWNTLYKKIEREEEKKGKNKNVADNQVLSPIEYWKNSTLRHSAYCILPQSGMIQQSARNAGDALTVLLRQESGALDRENALLYGEREYEGYICLFGYLDAEETTADICYWISDEFMQYAMHAEFLFDSEKEHCVLMAYAYSCCGLQCAGNESRAQHISDLKRVNDSARLILKSEFVFFDGE